MAQGSHQFTPSQILEAGRRAETEGRIEYAIQFYRHLTDHLARTPEAAAAREALTRLGAAVAPAMHPQHGPPEANGSYVNGAVVAAPQPAASGGGPVIASTPRPGATAMPGTTPAAHLPQPAPQRPVQNLPVPVAQHASQVDPAKRRLLLPRSRRRYRTGRVVARIVTFLGFIEVAIGFVVLVIGIIGRFVGVMPEFMAAQQLLGFIGGLVLAVAGAVQVLVGQLARAVFDTASANRDIAAMTRARAVADGGIVDDKPAQTE